MLCRTLPDMLLSVPSDVTLSVLSDAPLSAALSFLFMLESVESSDTSTSVPLFSYVFTDGADVSAVWLTEFSSPAAYTHVLCSSIAQQSVAAMHLRNIRRNSFILCPVFMRYFLRPRNRGLSPCMVPGGRSDRRNISRHRACFVYKERHSSVEIPSPATYLSVSSFVRPAEISACPKDRQCEKRCDCPCENICLIAGFCDCLFGVRTVIAGA